MYAKGTTGYTRDAAKHPQYPGKPMGRRIPLKGYAR